LILLSRNVRRGEANLKTSTIISALTVFGINQILQICSCCSVMPVAKPLMDLGIQKVSPTHPAGNYLNSALLTLNSV
jgi:hypothetical protein